MEIYQFISISLTVILLGTTIYTFRKTYALGLETRNLNLRRNNSEQYDEYSRLLHSEYMKLNEDLSSLAEKLCNTNASIGNLLDKYDSRCVNTAKQYQRHLRHIYSSLCDNISNNFKHELSYQNAENIYYRLGIFKDLDCRLNIQAMLVNTLEEPEGFSDSFIELTESFDKAKNDKLYNDFLDTCKELVYSIQKIKIKCKESYDLLESGNIKNNLQEFKLKENWSLNFQYKQYKCLMRLIDMSRVGNLNNAGETPCFTLSNIVYFGANINMLNELICQTSYSFNGE